jgi:hypothetical protein
MEVPVEVKVAKQGVSCLFYIWEVKIHIPCHKRLSLTSSFQKIPTKQVMNTYFQILLYLPLAIPLFEGQIS